LPFYAAAKVESQQKAAEKKGIIKDLTWRRRKQAIPKKQKQLWTPLQSSYKQTKMF